MQPLVRAQREQQEPEIPVDVLRVLPALLPASLIESPTWTGSFQSLPAPGVALAWAVPASGHSLHFLDRETQRQWEARGLDWKTQALKNLRKVSSEPLGTGALFREDGKTWLISLVYPDGLGPSRLLLTDELSRIFPTGYQMAMPERNRAFVFALELDREDRDMVENLLEKSYLNSDQPLSRGIFEPADLHPL